MIGALVTYTCVDHFYLHSLLQEELRSSLEFAKTFTKTFVYAGKNEMSLYIFCFGLEVNICMFFVCVCVCEHHVDVLMYVFKMVK